MLAWLLGNFANKENKGFYSIIIITMSAYYTSGADDGQNGQWKSRIVLELSIMHSQPLTLLNSFMIPVVADHERKLRRWTEHTQVSCYGIFEWQFLN